MNSIRRRLTVGLLTGFCILWASAGAGLYLNLRAGLLAEFDATLLARAQALSALTRQEKGNVELDFPGELIPGFERGRPVDYFQMWRADGTTLEQSPSLEGNQLSYQAGVTETPRYSDLTLPDGLPGRSVSLRFIPQGSEEAPDLPPAQGAETSVVLAVALHRTGLDHRLNLLATTLLVVGGLLAVATGFGVPAFVRRGLSPLDGLAEQAATIDVASLQLRFLTADLPAELLPICGRLNELLARLQASFERERQFSADLAHELRTPIAELRSLAEVALKWPEEPAATTRALQETLEIALQMDSIVTGLLTLARCEAGLQQRSCASIRVAALLEEIWEALTDPARRKQLAVSWDVAEDAWVETDPAMFRSILTNLLANAVEYSPEGGSIHVRFETGDAPWQITVSNTVDNITPAEVPHLFERFWRRDPARSSSIHNGLGLALARAFAELLGLEINAQLTASNTLTFTLRAQSASARSTSSR